MSDQNSKIIEIFRKIGNAILNIKKIPSKLGKTKTKLNKISRRRQIPSLLQNYMEKRDAGWPEYVMLKTQLGIIALFGASVVLSFFWVSPLILAPIIAGLVGYLTYLTLSQLKVAFSRDYPAYRSLVVLSIMLSLTIIFLRKLPITRFLYLRNFPYPSLVPVILILVIFTISFTLFRIKYGRDYTYGTVKRVKGGKAVVKIDYDVKSNVKNGLYFLETMEDVNPGDKVKVDVDRPFLGLRGSEPTSIMEKMRY